MRKRLSLSERLFILLNILMILIYACGGIILSFWNTTSVSASSRKLFSIVLLLYAAYRSFILYGKYKKMRDRINSLIIPLIILLPFISGCTSNIKHEEYTDTPTSGDIIIVADESYEPLIQAQIDTFMEIYKYAKIHVRYLPEAEVFNELMNNDSVRLAIVTRDLTDDERASFERQKIIPRSLKVARDAIALVANKQNADTAITFEQLELIIQGKIATWDQLNNGGLKDSIIIVFDKNGSANSRFLHEKFLKGKDFPKNIFATKSNANVVEYVSQNKRALGVVSVNWISDRDDSLSGEFLKKINVVALSLPDTNKSEQEFNKPFQAYIALKKYPLLRDVMIISREGRNGLGTGFASFVAGDKGQRMIRLMGLLPATMPVRIIQVN